MLNAPEIFNAVNGFQSLFKYGLVECYTGYGYTLTADGTVGEKCWRKDVGDYLGSSGHLTALSGSTLNSSEVIDRLNLLMTSGRLSDTSLEIIKTAYEAEFSTSGDRKLATIKAQQLISTTPEFHTTGRMTPNNNTRTDLIIPDPTGKPYKAVVFLMLKGGCDSYNMIVPTACNSSDLDTQYDDIRGNLKLSDKSKVINVTGHSCQQFALHPKLSTVRTLYNGGDLAFFLNTGVINAPSSSSNYSMVTDTRLFAHDTMQEEAKRLDPMDVGVGTGVLGRLSDALAKRGYQPSSISIDESSIAVTGTTGTALSPTIVGRDGVAEFNKRPSGEADIRTEAEKLNRGHVMSSSNVFGELWSARLSRALWESDTLKAQMDAITDLSETPDENLAEKFETTLKLMMTRDERGADRDVFYVSIGGFDTHNDMEDRLNDRFAELDLSLEYFKDNLQTKGLWENVTIVTISDFGRTLSPNNGEGSDHGWGGNYFVAGGSVVGGQALCEYPSDLKPGGGWNVGRGRIMPGCAWESMWSPIVEWMMDGNMTATERSDILPNAENTGTKLYEMSDLFV